jgi:predicted metal-dependent peptidase
MFDIVYIDEPKAIHDGVGCGMCSSIEEKIYLFRKLGFTDSTNLTTRIIDQSVQSIIATLYHEVYHAICNTCKMDDHNTEENAGLFSNIAVNLNKDDNLMGIFEQFKAIVTEIPEADYNKIAYVVANTEFEFDKLSDDYREVKIVVGYEDVLPDRNEHDEQVEESIIEDEE